MGPTPTSSGGGQKQPLMDKSLLKAATDGAFMSMQLMFSKDPSILRRTNPRGDNCLHLASLHGHQKFCKHVLKLDESLLSDTNDDGETPLIIAMALGHTHLASFLLKLCIQLKLNQTICHQDNEGFNVLHYAIRNGHRNIALELLAAETALSRGVNKYNESPMYMAVMKDFTDVSMKLLSYADSSHLGCYGRHALHAAARNGNQEIARSIVRARPDLATKADSKEDTPIRLAVCYNKVDVLRALLEHDVSLGYELSHQGFTLLTSAAARGHVDVARELLIHCPDAPYYHGRGEVSTCLHTAVYNGHTEFVQFILKTPQFQQLVNMRDSKGKTALHYAIEKCNPRIVADLLSCKGIDTTILDSDCKSAASQLLGIANLEKSLDWKEVQVLMLKADPKDGEISSYNLHEGVKQHETIDSRKERKIITQKYTSNTALAAILLATITFTAAFTLPGGYSSVSGNEGLPVMSRKMAFQVFLVSDTLAMCSSFVVAFICLMGRWEDDKLTTYYTSVTKKLTWFAYMATITAFSTGLYTVLDFQLHWLAIGICIVVGFVPILTMLIAKWPVLLSFGWVEFGMPS